MYKKRNLFVSVLACLLAVTGFRNIAAEESEHPQMTTADRASSSSADFDHQFYGDFAHRTTNLYLESYDYHAVSGWAENRLIAGTWNRSKHSVRPYIKTTVASSSHSLPWENTFVYGLGLEYRPWVDNARLDKKGLR